MYNLTDITANPYEESEEVLYDMQTEKRTQELNLLFTNHKTIKVIYDNSKKFDIISPSIKYKNGMRITWFNDNVILGHKDIQDNCIADLTDSYLYSENLIIELM